MKGFEFNDAEKGPRSFYVWALASAPWPGKHWNTMAPFATFVSTPGDVLSGWSLFLNSYCGGGFGRDVTISDFLLSWLGATATFSRTMPVRLFILSLRLTKRAFPGPFSGYLFLFRSLCHLKAGPPLEAILVIFGRRVLIFFCLKGLGKKWKMTPLLCACAVVITLETQKCRKRAPRSVEFNFFINCDRQKRFSQNERKRTDLPKAASDFLTFA